jgi:glycerol-3-phosphate dehydrogenase subunit B
MTTDVLVVGGGLAGLTAALRLTQDGLRVVVVAKGVGATHLTGGTVDVLGYAPERVDSPRAALPELVASRPDHPYALLDVELVERSLDWFAEAAGALGYQGSLDENLLLPSAAGARRPTALAPASMASGDLRAPPRLLVAGFQALKDFYPAYVADNLTLAGIEARATVLAASPRPGEADVNGLVYAAALDADDGFRRCLAEEIGARVEPGESVGLPAVLGLERAPEVWRELQDRIGAPVFEIPTLPPSVPGMRVHRRLSDALRGARARSILGAVAVGAETTNGRVDAVVVQDAARRRSYRARAFVLATGGIASGGLELELDGDLREPVLGLPVAGALDGSPFTAGALDPQPLSRAGLAVDEELRPVEPGGKVVYDNVHAVGAMLAGAEPWREKSGDGISVASGIRAAEAISERLR